MEYELLFTPRGERSWMKLDGSIRRRIMPRVEALRRQPRPPGAIKLTGDELYRLRAGDYRVVYRIDDSRRLIEIAFVAHRREVYRDL